ncbi:uncharacterized protein MELLADRAFT_114203 [Melampsora larici-populina 98AG31]|uniref:Uncharacterized protein n=1 Tax=Melampsora larici-populina (strain 98AG31 / pathotype 3-4-7) TaxID=747676 RepID=F4SCL3_MELLP|nr:uncharacterized protein MELLADRAFT_114203 [Melampsora larici-populina 98AG31]EGF97613.1 hypothetical protein MELLADRAFT_114203 [Melampsora larici-populina 98AG31]
MEGPSNAILEENNMSKTTNRTYNYAKNNKVSYDLDENSVGRLFKYFQDQKAKYPHQLEVDQYQSQSDRELQCEDIINFETPTQHELDNPNDSMNFYTDHDLVESHAYSAMDIDQNEHVQNTATNQLEIDLTLEDDTIGQVSQSDTTSIPPPSIPSRLSPPLFSGLGLQGSPRIRVESACTVHLVACT